MAGNTRRANSSVSIGFGMEWDPGSAFKRGSGAKLVQTELICRSEAIGAAWESRYSFCQFACWLPVRDLEVNFQQTQFITARRGFRRAPTLRQSPFWTPIGGPVPVPIDRPRT